MSMQPSAISGTRSGEQQAQGWKRFSVAGIPRAMEKPTVDDSTLTYKPENMRNDDKPGGPRLAWSPTRVKHLITTAPLPSVATALPDRGEAILESFRGLDYDKHWPARPAAGGALAPLAMARVSVSASNP
jgi:hypothetical protein